MGVERWEGAAPLEGRAAFSGTMVFKTAREIQIPDAGGGTSRAEDGRGTDGKGLPGARDAAGAAPP